MRLLATSILFAALIYSNDANTEVSSPASIVSWGYHEDRPNEPGPTKWGHVNAACNGTRQSPIDLVYDGPSVTNLWSSTTVAPIKFTGNCANYNLKKLDDLYKWELAGANACKVSLELEDGKTYSLLQFHVHTPSEHTIEGRHYSGEIHFVHKEDGGGSGLLVVALLLNAEEQAHNVPWIDRVWNTMDSGVDNEAVPVNLTISYVDLLNRLVRKSHLFNYSGSLTTPPCSEIVSWWVVNNPLSISLDELKRLRNNYKELPATNAGHDNRPTQPLNDRKIKYF